MHHIREGEGGTVYYRDRDLNHSWVVGSTDIAHALQLAVCAGVCVSVCVTVGHRGSSPHPLKTTFISNKKIHEAFLIENEQINDGEKASVTSVESMVVSSIATAALI